MLVRKQNATSVAAARPRTSVRGRGSRSDRDGHEQLEQTGQHVPDVPQRQRPQERHVVRDEPAAREERLHQPPEVPRPQRQDVEDLALVLAQVLEVVRRPAGPEEWQPEDNDHREADRRGL